MIKAGVEMQRDMDLIRAMLQAIESDQSGFAPKKIEVHGYDQEQIGYHATLLGEAGLAVVHDVTSAGSKSPEAMIMRLTWAGHEFLDASRENHIWGQAKELIAKTVGGASIQIWVAVLTSLVQKKLGL